MEIDWFSQGDLLLRVNLLLYFNIRSKIPPSLKFNLSFLFYTKLSVCRENGCSLVGLRKKAQKTERKSVYIYNTFLCNIVSFPSKLFKKLLLSYSICKFKK